MGRVAVTPSRALAGMLRDHRHKLGWTLRDVEGRSRTLGRPIPFATLAKVEQGKVDPGLRRLHVLLRIYDLPLGLAQDVLDLEEYAGELPQDVPSATLYEDAVTHWKAGDLRQGFAHLAELRVRTAEDTTDRVAQQKAILTIAIAAGSLGRYRLCRHMVDELLLTPPERELLVPTLVQAAVCWHWLGSGEAALGFLHRAEVNADPNEHRHGAWIAHQRSSTYIKLGRLDEAEESLVKAIDEYRKAKDTYGESRAIGARVRIAYERGDLDRALTAAIEGREHATRNDHHRLAVLRTLDEGRIRVANGELDEGIGVLSSGLGEAAAAQDLVAQFHAHYYLWKAFVAAGDAARAEVELSAAKYFVQFIDTPDPEVLEVRAAGTVKTMPPELAAKRKDSGYITIPRPRAGRGA